MLKCELHFNLCKIVIPVFHSTIRILPKQHENGFLFCGLTSPPCVKIQTEPSNTGPESPISIIVIIQSGIRILM